MDSDHEKRLDAAAKILDRDGLHVLPGNSVPQDADYHVCSDAPVPGVINHETICCKCGRVIFFSQPVPHLPKLCLGCMVILANTKPSENFVNMEAVQTAVKLHRQQN